MKITNIIDFSNDLNPLNVDLGHSIHIKWKSYSAHRFKIQIINGEGKCEFESHELSGNQRQLQVDLPLISGRKIYHVHLHLIDNEEHENILTKSFYTQNTMIHNAKWITRVDNPIEKEYFFFQDRPTMIFKKTFEWHGEKLNFIDICGLGYYIAKINGQRINDVYLSNDVTNYAKVVYYDTYEITPFLKKGENTIEVELGNGWYNPAPIEILGKYNVRKQLTVGKPCLIADIQIGETHVPTDDSWNVNYGQIIQNDIYIGEIKTDKVNQNEGFTSFIPGPAGKLCPGFIPKVKRHQQVATQNIRQVTSSQWIIDFGKIISGQIESLIKPDFQGHIILEYAEDLNKTKDGLDFSSTVSGRYGINEPTKNIEVNHKIIQKDEVIKTLNKAMIFENQFTYHSFRYVKVTSGSGKWPFETIHSYRVHTDVKQIADFKSSSNKLNQIWCAGLNTRLHNIHSYFEDCSRERLGYGGDTVALLKSHQATIETEPLFKKVMLDFVYDQRSDGGITQTAPYVGIMTNGPSHGAGSLGWQLILPTLAWEISQTYKDYDFVQDQHSALKHHLNYLLAFDYKYIKQCCLGDWGSIDEIKKGYFIMSPDQAFCSATMYLLILMKYKALFKALDWDSMLVKMTQEKIETVRTAIIADFYNEEKERFGEGTPSSQIFALKANLFEQHKKAYQDLIEMIKSRQGIFSFGIFGMSWAYELLSENGDNALVLQWLLRDQSPSYWDMLKSGNQTLSEHFSGEETFQGSKNHAMFSSYSAWFIHYLLGIQYKSGVVNFNPMINPELDYFEGYLETEYGKIEVNYSNEYYIIFVPEAIEFKTNLLTSNYKLIREK